MPGNLFKTYKSGIFSARFAPKVNSFGHLLLVSGSVGGESTGAVAGLTVPSFCVLDDWAISSVW